MIRLPGISNANLPSPWRRRISNQLAAFAAIMLFASTQVSSTQPQGLVGSSDMAGARSEQSADPAGEIAGTESEKLTGNADATRLAAGAKKDGRIRLSIFLLRR